MVLLSILDHFIMLFTSDANHQNVKTWNYHCLTTLFFLKTPSIVLKLSAGKQLLKETWFNSSEEKSQNHHKKCGCRMPKSYNC